jgi:hypothetical protein
MEPGTNFVALLRRWGDAGGVWRVLGHDRDKGPDSERDCGRDSLSYV